MIVKDDKLEISSEANFNVFNQDTIEKAKAVIAEQVAKGDINAAKLVISYSLSKPAPHQVGIAADYERAQKALEIKQIEQRSKMDIFNLL